MPRSSKTKEENLKRLTVKYIHERDALTWALNKAFEIAEEELNVDDALHFSTLQKLAKQHELGDSARWGELSDRIHELAKAEDQEVSFEDAALVIDDEDEMEDDNDEEPN